MCRPWYWPGSKIHTGHTRGVSANGRQPGVSITPQGLSDRFNQSAASLLHQILERAVSHVIAADPVAIPLLQRFSAVVLLDSTVVVLPNELAPVWRGCGGRTEENSQASVKLQVGLDLLGGGLQGPYL